MPTIIPRFKRSPHLIAPPEVTPRVLNILDALQIHGALSTPYLFRLLCPNLKDDAGFTDILQKLYHHSYVDRPMTLNHEELWRAPIVSRLDDLGRQTLKDHERLSPFQPPPSNDPRHDYMTACITCAGSIAIRDAGYSFLSYHDILSSKDCPEATRFPKTPPPIRGKRQRTPTPYDIPVDFYDGSNHITKPLTPDALFGIKYPDGVDIFNLQTDCNTEDGTSSDRDKPTIEMMLLRYQDIARNRTALTRFGVHSFMSLFVTFPESRVRLFERLAVKHLRLPKEQGGGQGASYIAATHIKPFGRYYTPPLEEMLDLFKRKWVRAGTEPFSFI